MPGKSIILDVCHNIQGFNAVLENIRVMMPNVRKVKVAFAISKKKSIEDVVELFDHEELISEVHVLSRPHMRLVDAQKAHDQMSNLGSKKLQPIIGNISQSLDHLVPNLESDELLIICGSFYIMSDVREYFSI